MGIVDFSRESSRCKATNSYKITYSIRPKIMSPFLNYIKMRPLHEVTIPLIRPLNSFKKLKQVIKRDIYCFSVFSLSKILKL